MNVETEAVVVAECTSITTGKDMTKVDLRKKNVFKFGNNQQRWTDQSARNQKWMVFP